MADAAPEPAAEPVAVAPEPTHDDKGREYITKEMMKPHSERGDCWMSIGDKVFDVTKYLEDHPGGEEVLLDRGGMDATEDFEDVGHSTEARKTLNQYEIGELPPSERGAAPSSSGGGGGGSGSMLALPVLLLAIGAGYYYFLQEQAP